MKKTFNFEKVGIFIIKYLDEIENKTNFKGRFGC